MKKRLSGRRLKGRCPFLLDHFIRLTTDDKSGVDVITIIGEYKDKAADTDAFKNRVRQAFREELEVTPGFELVAFDTLERTMFKAKRIEDKRVKAT